MRMGRWDWLDRFLGPKAKHAVGERAPRKQAPRTGRPERRWVVMGKVYKAMTKSEARARAKADHGGKLPVGIVSVAA